MYQAYCAACHGADGKGDGPASAALKSRPSDLTNLAKRNGGKFPELKVFGAINGDLRVAAHGLRRCLPGASFLDKWKAPVSRA